MSSDEVIAMLCWNTGGIVVHASSLHIFEVRVQSAPCTRKDRQVRKPALHAAAIARFLRTSKGASTRRLMTRPAWSQLCLEAHIRVSFLLTRCKAASTQYLVPKRDGSFDLADLKMMDYGSALRFCDFLIETQLPDGSWIDRIKDPDELLYYVDHAACFNVWLQEIATTLESKEALVPASAK